ncbi:hypothetical protein AZE42_06291 [Rhizopogon vesiculosus]|uniref:Calcineurin-like phosphoesterase domain-containing protein n=1 Tax=Rhizopogon vesiculosus TaxID=180088 RepID=A0A1J8R4P1_9AGAM|nr:hypothetical protein AZE42_06291 [Rhizopogon vesiculosus]
MSPPEDFHTASSKVYISYDPANPPAHPGGNWTRFICISDTHSHTFTVPSGDVLLHSGDLSRLGREDEMRVTVEWLRSLEHPVKIIIAGNHDLPLHREWYEHSYHRFHDTKRSPSEVRNLVDNKENRGQKGVVCVWFSSKSLSSSNKLSTHLFNFKWQPYYGGWAFNYLPEEAPARVAAIPEVDILLTHGPPHNVLDTTLTKVHAGCPALLAHLSEMKRPPLLHVFGHIHEAHGAMRYRWLQAKVESSSSNAEGTIPPTFVPRETIMVNAANQPLGRQAFVGGQRIPCGGPGFQPVIVDLLDSAT